MGSGKRASMREGPLANLFRKTETEGLGAAAAEPRAEEPARPGPRARHADAAGRLRHAFSSEVPGDMMAPPEEPPRVPRPPLGAKTISGARARERVGTPQLRVVGVGGAGERRQPDGLGRGFAAWNSWP